MIPIYIQDLQRFGFQPLSHTYERETHIAGMPTSKYPFSI